MKSALWRLIEPLENMHPIDRRILELSDHDWRIRDDAFYELLEIEDMDVDKRLRAMLQDKFFGGNKRVKKLLSLRKTD